MFNENFGVYVQNTIRNSPAQKAGLLPGDIITKVDGEATTNLLAGIKSISDLAPNTVHKIEVYRDGDRLLIPIMVAEHG